MRLLVSVVIDTHNHERFIEQAVVSAIEQDFPAEDFEILVVDDGSADGTAKIVRKFEPRVRLLQKQNGGQASAMNFGFAQAKGDLIAFLDGDDVWLHNKLSRVVEEFKNHSEAAMVYHQFSFWDSRTGGEWEAGWTMVSGDIVADRRKLRGYGAVPTSSLAFRRAALDRMMPIPEALVFMADAFLIATVIFLGPVSAIPESLAKNRVHGENLWFAETGKPDPNVLRRRIAVRESAIQAIRGWLARNAPESGKDEVRYFLRRWRLIQDADIFQLEEPGRIQRFVHLCRQARVDQPAYSFTWNSYAWLRAFAALVLGQSADCLAGLPRRVTRIKTRLQGRVAADRTVELK
jgi:glycosyltransferase involved in cell wall biosynthesis